MFDNIVYLICTGGGLGKLKPAPGTWGSLPGLALGYALHLTLLSYGTGLTVLLFLVLTGLTLLLIHHCEKTKTSHDSAEIVIDEILGQALAVFLFVPSLFTYLGGFIIFRALDILKPGPIGWADRQLPGAPGTLFDDLIAGAFTAGIISLVQVFY